MSGKDAKARIWDESDEELSRFDDSEWDEVEADDNNVCGYPNDRYGRVYSDISQESATDATRLECKQW